MARNEWHKITAPEPLSALIHTQTTVISKKPPLFQCKHKSQCTYKHICCTFHLNTKGKFHPITGHEGPDLEQRYSSILSLTSALDRVGGQRHAPTALPPGKTRYPLFSTRYSCYILTKLEFSRQIFEKCQNIKFHENPIHGSRGVPPGRENRRTDRRKDGDDEANSRFCKFCERD